MVQLLFILIVGTFFFSALLTPPVFSLICSVYPDFGYPFSRVFDRVAMVVLALFVLIYRKEFQFSGFEGYFSKANLKLKITRLLLGTVITSTLVAVALACVLHNGKMVRTIESVNAHFILKMLGVFGSAILISLLEEGFFRVLFFNRLKQRFNVIVAALISAMVYGVVHFITPVKSFVYEEFSFWAGFVYLKEVCLRMLQPGFLAPYFGMVSIGLLLCYTIHKTKSFALCVGLHSGFIIGMKLVKYTAKISDSISIPAGAGERYFVVGQPEAWLALGITFLVIYCGVRFSSIFSKDERVKEL
ncbi:MAG: CPBP family intramembrane glutamic endopeptidase [Bdellovibrionota bacterium]|jgi:membrane protease YdiL (CAAX protease family)